MPNKETEFLLLQIFGRKSYPMLKFVRMKLWFSRFKNINPFPVPRDLPQDPVELARLGLRHMEPDLSARVTIYQVSTPATPPAAAGAGPPVTTPSDYRDTGRVPRLSPPCHSLTSDLCSYPFSTLFLSVP